MVAAATEQRSEVPVGPNTGPFGCLAWQHLAKCKQDGSPCAAADEHGCVKDDNNVAQQFNDELKDRVNKLRAKYPGAAITLDLMNHSSTAAELRELVVGRET
ncbi:hypothetical protein C3L33_18962, partial [Rhododendron williamsianum]